MLRTLMLLSVAAASAASQSPSQKNGALTLSSQSMRFVPVNPARPDAASMAVLQGDPNSGPSDMLMRMPGGTNVQHIHSADYKLTVISGRMKHWQQGESESSAEVLGPGSFWFQPGNVAHADACVDDSCLMFISWSGKRDAKVAP